MFSVDADCFKIVLPNGYTLAFFPCDENGTPFVVPITDTD